MKKVIYTLVGCVVLSIGLIASADDTRKINELVQAGKWKEAIPLLESATRATPSSGQAWSRLANAYRQTKQYEKQIAASEKAITAGFQPRFGLISVASAQVALGNNSAALTKIEEVAAPGQSGPIQRSLEANSAFDPIKNDPRWKASIRKLTPCTSEKYRQFDFWVGDFKVEGPNGNYVGDNEITMQLDGCMLLESWKGASGMHGMSTNFYDPSDDTWNQYFIDNNGTPQNWPALKGKLEENGSMVLWTAEGESRSRWTWTKITDDKVRQMAETTADGGETWQVVWDSYYVRKK